MSSRSLSSWRTNAPDLIRTGLYAGLAGGLAEIVVVWAYSAFTSGDAAMVARQVGAAIGLDATSVIAGIAIHLGLAAALGLSLTVALRSLAGRDAGGYVLPVFMIGSLAIVWMINFFILLPMVSPGFAHLLPYPVTLASKLLFGLAAAATLHIRSRRLPLGPWVQQTTTAARPAGPSAA